MIFKRIGSVVFPVTLLLALTVIVFGSTSSVAVATPLPQDVLPGNVQIMFSMEPGIAGQPVVMTGTAEGSNLTWFWDFGDQSSAGSGITVTHSWHSSGTYTVTVYAFNLSGSAKAERTISIVDLSPKNLNITFGHNPMQVGQVVIITGTAEGPNLNYEWHFWYETTMATGETFAYLPKTVGQGFIDLEVSNEYGTANLVRSFEVDPQMIYLPMLMR